MNTVGDRSVTVTSFCSANHFVDQSDHLLARQRDCFKPGRLTDWPIQSSNCPPKEKKDKDPRTFTTP
jgi:hypothetical protein